MIEELSKAWISYYEIPEEDVKNLTSKEISDLGKTQEKKKLFWAVSELMDISLSAPEECWNICLDIIKKTNNEYVLANVGAGPIETILCNFPDVTICLIEKEISKNEKLKQTLANVWKSNMPDSVWNRLQSVL